MKMTKNSIILLAMVLFFISMSCVTPSPVLTPTVDIEGNAIVQEEPTSSTEPKKLSDANKCLYTGLILLVLIFGLPIILDKSNLESQTTFSTTSKPIAKKELERLARELERARMMGNSIVESRKMRVLNLMMQSAEARHMDNYALEAIFLQDIVSLEPNLASAWLNLARSYYDLGKVEDSVLANKKALEIYPKYVKAWCNLGIVYLNEWRNFKRAEQYFQEALASRPSKSEAKYIYRALGDLYFFHQLDFERTINAYQKAQNIGPSEEKIATRLKNLTDPEFRSMVEAQFDIQNGRFTPEEVEEFLGSRLKTSTRWQRDDLQEMQQVMLELLSVK